MSASSTLQWFFRCGRRHNELSVLPWRRPGSVGLGRFRFAKIGSSMLNFRISCCQSLTRQWKAAYWDDHNRDITLIENCVDRSTVLSRVHTRSLGKRSYRFASCILVGAHLKRRRDTTGWSSWPGIFCISYSLPSSTRPRRH